MMNRQQDNLNNLNTDSWVDRHSSCRDWIAFYEKPIVELHDTVLNESERRIIESVIFVWLLICYGLTRHLAVNEKTW